MSAEPDTDKITELVSGIYTEDISQHLTSLINTFNYISEFKDFLKSNNVYAHNTRILALKTKSYINYLFNEINYNPVGVQVLANVIDGFVTDTSHVSAFDYDSE